MRFQMGGVDHQPGRFAGLARQFGVLEKGTLVGIEVGVHLVGGHQRGEQRFAGGHQVAGGHFSAADAAIDRRGDAGEAEVQTGVVEFGLDAAGIEAAVASLLEALPARGPA